MSEVGNSPSTVVDAVLRLSGECAEHLVEPGRAGGLPATTWSDRIAGLPIALGARHGAPGVGPELLTAMRTAPPAGAAACEAYAERKRAREALDFGDQLALAARLARDFPDIGRAERAAHPRGAAGRVPGHQPRPAGDAATSCSAAATR